MYADLNYAIASARQAELASAAARRAHIGGLWPERKRTAGPKALWRRYLRLSTPTVFPARAPLAEPCERALA